MADARSNPPATERDSLADDLRHTLGGELVEDGTEAIEAEVPADNIARISDATLPSRAELAAAFERKAKAAAGKRR